MKSPSLAALLLAAGLVVGLPAEASQRPVIVISDIDDTIKDTGVVREILSATRPAVYRKNYAHLAGDPFRAWTAVEGMVACYRTWSRRETVEFIYLSKGPWCYRSRLARFLRSNRFPAGCVDLNPHFPFAARGYKSAPIQKIIRARPGCAFVLVGDSSEDDPEVYGRIAAQFSSSVRRVFIRDIAPRGPPSRFATAFAGMPGARRQLFTSTRQLPATPLARLPKAKSLSFSRLSPQ
jgi:phosphatidate phosphatase APP1